MSLRGTGTAAQERILSAMPTNQAEAARKLLAEGRDISFAVTEVLDNPSSIEYSPWTLVSQFFRRPEGIAMTMMGLLFVGSVIYYVRRG